MEDELPSIQRRTGGRYRDYPKRAEEDEKLFPKGIRLAETKAGDDETAWRTCCTRGRTRMRGSSCHLLYPPLPLEHLHGDSKWCCIPPIVQAVLLQCARVQRTCYSLFWQFGRCNQAALPSRRAVHCRYSADILRHPLPAGVLDVRLSCAVRSLCPLSGSGGSIRAYRGRATANVVPRTWCGCGLVLSHRCSCNAGRYGENDHLSHCNFDRSHQRYPVWSSTYAHADGSEVEWRSFQYGVV
mmetsp:Transcript_19041/g.48701  ORF Transcript_19041/g.48701 Transcript_19041/m.48701 type:complete len:241 (+) Transcript_19041:1120-1842(+)